MISCLGNKTLRVHHLMIMTRDSDIVVTSGGVRLHHVIWNPGRLRRWRLAVPAMPHIPIEISVALLRVFGDVLESAALMLVTHRGCRVGSTSSCS